MDIVINAEIDAAPESHTPLVHLGNYYHHILACLGYVGDEPPIADLLRRYHGLEGEWLIASPIHWQATHNDGMIIASGHELQLSDHESRLWFTALAEFVAADNISLHYHDAYTWLLQMKGQPQIAAKPVYALQHKSMMPELRGLDATHFWQRFITENQMFFSAHPLNQTRQDLYPINGVWVWGGGKLHERVHKPLICQGENLVKLAKQLSTQVSVYPSSPLWSKQGLLLFEELGKQELIELQTELQNHTVCWYWNNLAYLSKPKSWLSRLIERI